jgi:hypothetical protein
MLSLATVRLNVPNLAAAVMLALYPLVRMAG